MKKTASIIILVIFILTLGSCTSFTNTRKKTNETPPQEGVTIDNSANYLNPALSTKERVVDLLSRMTLEEKAAQMVQGERGQVSNSDLKKQVLGSILSGGGSVPRTGAVEDWNQMITGYQDAILSNELQIPLLYGIDAVHGHSNVKGAVIFPQNIGLGAANDPSLTKEMGKIVAAEMKLTKIIWNFSPCVALASDPRWGRTYESYSTDISIVTDLAQAYYEGLSDSGVIATAKHYVADGGVKYGTGNGGNLIDRGDAQMTEDKLRTLHLKPYTALVKAGVPVVMASFSSFNGVPMHENAYLLTDVLKIELGFQGFIVSDWEAIHLLKNGKNFNEQVALAVNAGIDMLMEPNDWSKAIDDIVTGVRRGSITQARIDDAVSRILTVKFNAGLFEDPYLKKSQSKVTTLGSDNGRQIAEELVSKSLVLLKNENNILPLKSNQTLLVLGEAANNIGLQCGGWTMQWQGAEDKNGVKITEGTTILEGLQRSTDYAGIEVTTDLKRASEADAILIVLSEMPYAEMLGDTADLSIIGDKTHPDNQAIIDFAKAQNVPVITLIVAGRHVLIDDYIKDWDAVVMCYLPGSEGQGIAPVLLGQQDFTGHLPMPWYKDVDDIGKPMEDLLYPIGFGLNYADQ